MKRLLVVQKKMAELVRYGKVLSDSGVARVYTDYGLGVVSVNEARKVAFE
jgi:hypothetical protein